jgi:3-oxosteroid 1-dehydrogenase
VTEPRSTVTRRRLLAGVGATTAALATVKVGTSTANAADHWDQETDILLVGSGIGASTAAVVAHDNGDQVILLEKAPIYGGTSAKSAGVLWIPNNFVLRQRGIKDSKRDCLGYMTRYSYPQRFDPNSPTLGLDAPSYALLEAFYDNASPAADLLHKNGALDLVEWRMFGLDRPATDYLDNVPENIVSAGRALGVRKDDGSVGIGVHLMAQLERAVKKRTIPVLMGHRATELIRNDAGRVIGLKVSQGRKELTIKARKGVVFATGGYAHNAQLTGDHQRARFYGSCALPMATGDFISIAGAAGARMGNMSGAWRTQVLVEEALKSSVLALGVFLPPGDSAFQVNKYGRRAVNESRNYNDRAEVHGAFDSSKAEYPNQLMFMIYDQRTAEGFAGMYPLPETPTGSPYVIHGDTLEDLTHAIEQRLTKLAPHTGNLALDPAFAQNLKTTLSRYNGFARTGKDEDFHRGDAEYDEQWKLAWGAMRADSTWPPNTGPSINMHPLSDKGPYYAQILGAGALDTNGGPAIDASARVLDTQGRPIPGLYGAGNCIASPSREAYWGAGCPLALSLTYGYIAANHAHGEA